MRETKYFSAFGVDYRTRHFAAYGAVGMFGRLDEIHPTELLALTEVRDGEEWHSLGSPQNIDRYVRDVLGIVRPHEVLAALMSLVKQYNFGFKVAKVNVPHRFRSKTEEKDDPGGMHPVLSWLYTEKQASWRELQEDYTLEDAFRMHRELLKSKVKAALESEAAQKEAKAKAKGG
ncbi:hypothetical protein PWR63_19330 [Paraburkholderia sp. A2WS-5]|uniref:hypothetical protein n=1 Tax=unclassified Paraburkholderia TaxID=2615204 RepID=UPI003B7B90AE